MCRVSACMHLSKLKENEFRLLNFYVELVLNHKLEFVTDKTIQIE